MRRRCLAAGLAALCALLAITAGVWAQESEAPSCEAAVKAALSPLHADLKAVTDKHAKAASEAAACKTASDELKGKMTAAFEAKSEEVEKLKASLAAAEHKLAAALEKAAAHPTELDLPAIITALGALAKRSGALLVKEVQLVAMEAKHGKFTRLEGHVSATLHHIKTACSAAVGFVVTEADEHLPPAVKAKLSELAAKARTAWKVNVQDAEWARPLLAQVSQVNAEVTKVVTHAVRRTPALAPLADPVTIQLLVYAVFALPALLLLLLPCLLTGRRGSAGSGSSGAAARKAKKGPRGRA